MLHGNVDRPFLSLPESCNHRLLGRHTVQGIHKLTNRCKLYLSIYLGYEFFRCSSIVVVDDQNVQRFHDWLALCVRGAAFSPLANSPAANGPLAKSPPPAVKSPPPPSYANYILTYHYHRCCVARSPLTFEVVDSSVIVHIS